MFDFVTKALIYAAYCFGHIKYLYYQLHRNIASTEFQTMVVRNLLYSHKAL